MSEKIAQPSVSGKRKTLYLTDNEQIVRLFFSDALVSLPNPSTEASILGKGALCHRINALLMRYLAEQGFATHWVAAVDACSDEVALLKMLPFKVVVRYRAAGRLSERLGLTHGMLLEQPITELYYKGGAGHPWVAESHLVALGWASERDVREASITALQIAHCLRDFFATKGVLLVDLQLEFGRDGRGQLVLGDEISPDTCRLWDQKTQKSLDKERLQEGLGGLMGAYTELAERLGA